MKAILVPQGSPDCSNLEKAIKAVVAADGFDRLDVAVAYATEGGLKVLLGVLPAGPIECRWLIGLDDAVTQPKLLRSIRERKDSDLRVCSLGPSRRFHPKIYCLWSSTNEALCALVVGSGNLTNHGLQKNAEVGSILLAETVEDVAELKEAWRKMWALGQALTDQLFSEYEDAYKQARKARRKTAKKTKFVPQVDGELEANDAGADLVSTLVHAGWVDIGSAMAKGREIEFPKDMLSSIGIAANEASPKTVELITKDGHSVEAQFKRRDDNGMWRIHIPKEVPGSDKLRTRVAGKLERSKKALVLEKSASSSSVFTVNFIDIGSDEYEKLMQRSKKEGIFNRTKQGPSGRNFGAF